MPRLVRDTVLFVVGLGLIVNEAIRVDEPRFSLLVVYTAMVGLPAFLTTDGMETIERFVRRRSNGNGHRAGIDTPDPPKAQRKPKSPPLAFGRTA